MEQVLGNLSVLAGMPIFNLGLLIDGLLVASIFALAAYGLALVWGVMNGQEPGAGRLHHDRRLYHLDARAIRD